MCLQYRSTVLHCLFDVPYVEGRGETRFFDVPREPLRVGPGPRCESDSLRPTPKSGGGVFMSRGRRIVRKQPWNRMERIKSS